MRMLLAGSALIAGCATGMAKDAIVGETVPGLTEVTWVQGEPVSAFEDGEVYVLDFWATWCGPCIRAMPHMNELAAKHENDATFIGVHIWPRESSAPPSEWIEKRKADGKEVFEFAIAEDIDRRTAETWMDPNARTGIPTTMVINGDGRLVWMGHPMELDEPLQQIIDGTYDLEAKLPEYRTQIAAASDMRAAMDARESGDAATLMRKGLEAIRAAPDNYGHYAGRIYRSLLVDAADKDLAEVFLSRVLTTPVGKNPHQLNGIAWQIATEYPAEQRDLNVALVLARKSCEMLDYEDASSLDTLARVHYEMGNLDLAIQEQRRAIDAAGENEGMREQLEAVLDEYEDAAAKR